MLADSTIDMIYWLMARCKCSVNITVNERKDYYETIDEPIEIINMMLKDSGDESLDDEIVQAMREHDCIVCVQCYPDSPVGFCQCYHYDLHQALSEVVESIKEVDEGNRE